MSNMGTPPRRPSVISIRVYAVGSDGSRRELPTVPLTELGVCGVPGCTCLGKRR